MKKQKKQLIVLVVLLLICLGAYAGIRLYNQHVSDSKKKTEEANTIHITKIAEKDIMSFSYTLNGNTLSFTKKNNVWSYDADQSIALDQSVIKTMLATLRDVKSTDQIKKYDAASTYGFDNPAFTLTVGTKDKTNTFRFGMTNAMVGGTYVMFNSDASIYLVDSTYETNFEKTIDELKAKPATTESTQTQPQAATQQTATE